MTEIKIYIHGRPMGQDVWCSGNYSVEMDNYIKPFLDSKIGSEVNSSMIIDTWNRNTLYTYIRRKNIFEKGRRGPGYFAITLCLINSVCHKVSLLYNLFDRIYEQKCIGSILMRDNGGREQYSISRFSEKENIFKDIESIICTNFEHSFNCFVNPIAGLTNTIQSSPIQYSILEVDSPLFVSDAASSKILISKDYQTTREEGRNLISMNQILHRDNQSLRTTNQSLQETNQSLRTTNQSLQETNQSLVAENSDLKKMYEKEKSENEKVDKNLYNCYLHIKDPLIELARYVSSQSNERINKENTKDNKKGHNSNILIELPKINAIILCIIIVVVCSFILFLNVKSQKETNNMFNELKELIMKSNSPSNLISQHASNTTNVDGANHTQLSDEKNDSSLSIDIGNYKSGNLKKDVKYLLTLKGVNEEIKEIKWTVEAKGKASIRKDTLTVKKEGEITINAEVDGVKVASRTISYNNDKSK